MNSTATRRQNMRPNSGRSLQHGDGSRPAPNITSELNRQRNQDCAIDGVYKNSKFTFHLTTLVGCTVEAYTKNGKCYEGIFKTFSPELEVVMECVHLLDLTDKDRTPTKDRVLETLIIAFKDLATMTAIDADTKYGETDSFTDSAISKSQANGVLREPRELTPFVIEAADERPLEELGSSVKGWTPEKMFKDHEEKYGKKSTFDEEQYTTKLPSADTPGFEQRKREAERYASEIEADLSSRRHTALENGDEVDEETRFSAVSRPMPSSNTSNTNKYTPPALRSNTNKSNAQLSQSARLNGMPPRPTQEKHKPPSSTPKEDILKLKKWNTQFVLKSDGPATSPPVAVQQTQPPAEVDSRQVTNSETPAHSAKPVSSSTNTSTAGTRATAKPEAPMAPTTSPKPAPQNSASGGAGGDTAVSPASAATPVSTAPAAQQSATPATLTSTPAAPASTAPASAAPASAADTKPAAATKGSSDDKISEIAGKSILNPEAKEFKPVAAAAPVSSAAPVQQQQQHHNTATHQHHYTNNNKSSKTATVSVVEARPPPTGRPDIPTPAQAMGQPLINPNHHQPQYYIIPPPHRPLQRVPSYPGNEGQPGQPHCITAHPSYLPPQFAVQNGMSGHISLPQAMGGQQQQQAHANMASTQQPPAHNGNVHPSMSAHGGQAGHQQQGAPPTPTNAPTVSQQHIHTPNAGYTPHGAYMYPMSGPQSAGQQPPQATQPAQPPLQPSPHNPNPSPSPAPPMPNNNGGPASYPNYPPPSQQFYQPVGPPPGSQGGPQYPAANQQLVYIHPAGHVHSQFGPQVYHTTYPVTGYPPPNFSAPQQQ